MNSSSQKDQSQTKISKKSEPEKTKDTELVKGRRRSTKKVIDESNLKDKSTTKKKKLKWAKVLVEEIKVPSFKKYNLENCHDDPVNKDKTKCDCVIF